MTTTIGTTTNNNIFADFNDDDDDYNKIDDDTKATQTVRNKFGLFTRPFYDEMDNSFLGCVQYSPSNDDNDDDSERDPKFRTGQAFGIITVLLLTVSSISISGIVVCFNCSSNHRSFLWRASHYVSIGAAISQLLTLAALGSTEKCDADDVQNGGCTISGSAKLAIFNTILLDGLCLAWFFIPVPSAPLIHVQRYTHPIENELSPEALDEELPADIHLNGQKNCHTNDETESIVSECTIAEFNVVETPPMETTTTNNKKTSSPPSIRAIQIPSQLQQYVFQYRLTMVLLLGIAWMVAILGTNRCTFVYTVGGSNHSNNFSTDNDDGGGNSDRRQYPSGMGLYQKAIYDDENSGNFLGCVSYPSHTIHDTFDDQFRTARAFGAMTTLLTSTILVLGILQLFHAIYKSYIYLAIRMLLPLAIIFQASTFTILRSNVCNLEELECRLGGTGKLVILNILLMSLVFVLVVTSPIPKEPLFEVTWTKLKPNIITDVSNVPLKSASEAFSSFILCAKHFLQQKVRYDDEKDKKPAEQSRKDDISGRFDDAGDLHVISITVQVEYSDTGKTTRKITTYHDGTQTIQTRIEELYDDDDEDADFVVNDNLD